MTSEAIAILIGVVVLFACIIWVAQRGKSRAGPGGGAGEGRQSGPDHRL